MQWLFCYGFAQRHGIEFRCPEWIGERIFDLPKYERPDGRRLERYNEIQLMDESHWSDRNLAPGCDVEFRGYAQTQFCAAHYTKRQAQSWLKLRPEIEAACYRNVPSFGGHGDMPVICHLRRGDYAGYGYPIVRDDSYRTACAEFGLDWGYAKALLSEEAPTPHAGLPDDLSFMPDFYRMMTAKTLLRANSSFSWLAALLGNGLVLSPVIDGLEGGKYHDCRFVAGNHPKFANLSFVEDLHVAP